MEPMDQSHARHLIDAARAHARVEGKNMLPVPGAVLFRADQRTPCTSTLYDPCMVIVLQGSKRGFLKGNAFRYDPDTYAVYTAPMPLEVEVLSASPERPFLGVALMLNPGEIAELQLSLASENEMGEDAWDDMEADILPEAVITSPIDQGMRAAVARLIHSLDDPTDARVLGDLARREILFRALRGEQGARLRAVLHRHGRFKRIGDVIREINTDYSRPMTTSEMMGVAGMSKTVLHESFKAVTGLSPLQYVKSIRLHRARVLMLEEGMSARAAAYRVGYASPSQFSREFKRLFGRPPSESQRAAR
ncbi:AraC family transcriptional regulator [Marivibrio halodurans]|uniref:AraC family transcriptional regulator n=1 Tax=Marivibrio halodurans TaxID=2039722 RepID=A0A8J7V288_9PROT|nr:AraC family transcriptional regulator [Marivibrio halodurans]MBP5857115.1 AraC family transcriptional regulator [Marivibrio halodurans]